MEGNAWGHRIRVEVIHVICISSGSNNCLYSVITCKNKQHASNLVKFFKCNKTKLREFAGEIK